MKCLNCNSNDIGKIGKQQYYCWNCCIEFTINGEKLDLFQVEKDGTVSSLNDLFFDVDLPPEEVIAPNPDQAKAI
ncbi:hypothetical protein A8990_12038 [Paenibacillus taihuensis]|uniref:Uncharacterized protein n=1 Tax=Paenibacillus taihuensis TaxID=1156355 RepID=A0A3D9RWI8_9BACL|nr:hypothetical protein [Paenibacillus taihuensis]REE80992.1 hypothetical protein A8990_12038 [Paenibacillus taihuensis]